MCKIKVWLEPNWLQFWLSCQINKDKNIQRIERWKTKSNLSLTFVQPQGSHLTDKTCQKKLILPIKNRIKPSQDYNLRMQSPKIIPGLTIRN